jgi:HPt (histidine-containing phosphotransfer) domain-containing protein
MTSDREVPMLAIDPAPIDELVAVFGIDEAREAVVRLADGIERKLADLRCAGGASGALRRPAHDLASLAGCLGLVALEQTARAVELACEAGDEAAARAGASVLATVGDRVPFVVANAFVESIRRRLPVRTA